MFCANNAFQFVACCVVRNPVFADSARFGKLWDWSLVPEGVPNKASRGHLQRLICDRLTVEPMKMLFCSRFILLPSVNLYNEILCQWLELCSGLSQLTVITISATAKKSLFLCYILPCWSGLRTARMPFCSKMDAEGHYKKPYSATYFSEFWLRSSVILNLNLQMLKALQLNRNTSSRPLALPSLARFPWRYSNLKCVLKNTSVFWNLFNFLQITYSC